MGYKYSQDLLSGEVDAPKEEPYSYSKSLLDDGYGSESGFIGNQPVNSVMTQLEGQEDPASLKTEFKTGIVDDPKTRISIYAANRFPDEPEEERIKRYGTHNGEVVYMGDDGKLYPETPDTWLSHIKRGAAREGAHLPTYLMTAATAAATSGILPVVLAALGGEGYRKVIAALKYKESQTTSGNVKSMGVEGGLTLLGEGVTRGVAKGANSLLAGRAGKIAKEAGIDRATISVPEVEHAEKLGKKFGVDLKPHQTTGSAVLEAKYNLLGDLPGSTNIISASRKETMGQVDTAIGNFLDSFAQASATPLKVGAEVVDAAKAAVKRPITIRHNKAEPIYTKAFKANPEVDVKPIIDFIDDKLKNAKAGVRAHLLKAKKVLLKPDLPKKPSTTTATDEYGQVLKTGVEAPIGKYETSLLGLHHSKIALGDAIEAAKKKGTGSFAKRNYKQVEKLLLEQMDKASPDYKKARKIFSTYSEEIQKQNTKTLISTLSKLEGDDMALATKRLFGSIATSPETISKAKRLIKKENPLVWNKIVRVHLENTFDLIKNNISGNTTNIAGHFQKNIWGSPALRKKMRRILDPAQYEYMGDFMEVLQRASRGHGKESVTATRQIAIEELKRSSASRGIRAATRPLYTWQRLIGDKINDTLLGKRSRELAIAMTSKKSAKELKKLKQLSANSIQFNRQLNLFLDRIGGHAVKEKVAKERTPDIQPPMVTNQSMWE